MSIDAEEAAIRTVILGALRGALKPANATSMRSLQCDRRKPS
jgi:hypothetical protein